MKTFLSLALLSLAATSASAAPLVDRTYQVRVSYGTFSCRDGIPPNGHNYPENTTLTFSLPSYDLWRSDVWTNVSDYRAQLDYQPCDQFSQLLRPAPEQDLVGTVHQVITESNHLNGDKKSCLRDTREDSTLVVGGVTFSGVAEFMAGPMDPKSCQ